MGSHAYDDAFGGKSESLGLGRDLAVIRCRFAATGRAAYALPGRISVRLISAASRVFSGELIKKRRNEV